MALSGAFLDSGAYGSRPGENCLDVAKKAKRAWGRGRRGGGLTREERIKIRRWETGQDSMVTQRQKMTG